MLDETQNIPATLTVVSDLVEEYNAKRGNIDTIIKEFETANYTLNTESIVHGTYTPMGWASISSPHKSYIEDRLLKSAWQSAYKLLNIARVASAKDRSRFEMSMEKPPEFTFDNVRATFGDYLLNPRDHILRGLAECFCGLDKAYKSHSNVKIGIKGLPKKIIVAHAGMASTWSQRSGRNRILDAINALLTYQGKPTIEMSALRDWIEAEYRNNNGYKHIDYEKPVDGLDLKVFKNDNVHVIFGKEAMRDINLALAEYYGDVLPDTPEAAESKQPRTDVCRDLQYYPSPKPVVEALLRDHIFDRKHVLEPSCGDGRIMDGLKEYASSAEVTGVEVHPGRADAARRKGHSVMTENFLIVSPDPRFDYVIMNPPFYGKHWLKHIRHAQQFLKEDGWLLAVLPATAYYDHWDEVRAIFPKARWSDLPLGSFSESGTNVPTGILKA